MDCGRLAGECFGGGSEGMLLVGHSRDGAGLVLHGCSEVGGLGWCYGLWPLLVKCAAVWMTGLGREELDVGIAVVLLDWLQREDWSAWQWRCLGHWVWFCMGAQWQVGKVVGVGSGSCWSGGLLFGLLELLERNLR